MITGAGGLIGGALAEALAASGDEGIALPRAALDITDPAAVRAALDRHRPAAVINAAAQADVNGADREPERSFAVNGAAVGDLARACAERGVRLVHLSTDYVLDYPELPELTEDLTPCPRSTYARSKLAGEEAALRSGAEAVVVRVQWVYRLGTRGFFNLALRRLRAGQPLRLVTDQVGRPTPARLLVPPLLAAARGGPVGLFHLACAGEASAEDWICAAARLQGLSAASAARVTRADLGGAYRPARSCLCMDRFAAAWGMRLPAWDAALAAELVP